MAIFYEVGVLVGFALVATFTGHYVLAAGLLFLSSLLALYVVRKEAEKQSNDDNNH
jgi:hypothetical protein